MRHHAVETLEGGGVNLSLYVVPIKHFYLDDVAPYDVYVQIAERRRQGDSSMPGTIRTDRAWCGEEARAEVVSAATTVHDAEACDLGAQCGLAFLNEHLFQF